LREYWYALASITTSPNILVQFYRTSATVYIDDIVIKTSEPTTQASSITFSSVASNSMAASWTNGNGGRRAVFMKASSGSITNPTDGVAYTASTDWNSKGTQLGTSGYYCVYNGTESSVSLTNLVAGTTYYFQVFEYNSNNNTTPTAASINYFTNSGTNNPNSQTTSSACTAPSTQTSGLSANTTTTSNNNSKERLPELSEYFKHSLQTKNNQSSLINIIQEQSYQQNSNKNLFINDLTKSQNELK